MTIDWGFAGQVLVVWLVLSVIAAPFIGNLLYKLRTRREFQGHLAREARCQRLVKLVELADEFDLAATEPERSRIFRKASDLGFTDGPFMLDEQSHPHPKDAA